MDEGSLRQVLARLGTVGGRVSSKGWLPANCPLAPWTHKSGRDKHASFAVKVETEGTSLYTCLGCKHKGSVAQLVRDVARHRNDENLMAYAKELAGREEDGEAFIPDWDQPATMQPVAPAPLDEDQWFGLFDDIASVPEAARFMVSRGVHRETAAKLGLSYDPDERRIVFPVRGAGGELYGFSGRAIRPEIKPKVKDYGGLPKRHLILGRERWQPGKPVVIVEGLFAYARFHEIGAEEVANIGALLGSEITPEKADIIQTFGHTAILIPDPDEAGDACLFGPVDEAAPGGRDFTRGGIYKLLDHVPVMVPAYPNGIDDPDDLTLEHVRRMVMDTDLFDASQWVRKRRD